MEKNTTPQCIGIIIDGNRRWARVQGMPQIEGHKAGYKKFYELLTWARRAEIPYIIVYAFSTENWNRTESEILYAFDLFRTIIREQLEQLIKEKIRLQFIGEISRFPEDIQELIDDAQEKTKEYTEYTLTVALSYGGRAEIVHAANQLLGEHTEQVDETDFAKKLWTKDIPDPDLIIRTGGEKRLSNFLLWQAVYSELFFSDTLWPDFSEEEFSAILDEFSKRERRMGQ